MTRWALRQVRHGLYAPLEVLGEVGVVPPCWMVEAIVAIDRRLLRALRLCVSGRGVSGS